MPQQQPPFLYSRDPAWCLAYVKGRINGYRKGNLGLAAVAGAIRLARVCKVPVDQIVSAARAAGLEYDPNTEVISGA